MPIVTSDGGMKQAFFFIRCVRCINDEIIVSKRTVSALLNLNIQQCTGQLKRKLQMGRLTH